MDIFLNCSKMNTLYLIGSIAKFLILLSRMGHFLLSEVKIIKKYLHLTKLNFMFRPWISATLDETGHCIGNVKKEHFRHHIFVIFFAESLRFFSDFRFWV